MRVPALWDSRIALDVSPEATRTSCRTPGPLPGRPAPAGCCALSACARSPRRAHCVSAEKHKALVHPRHTPHLGTDVVTQPAPLKLPPNPPGAASHRVRLLPRGSCPVESASQDPRHLQVARPLSRRFAAEHLTLPHHSAPRTQSRAQHRREMQTRLLHLNSQPHILSVSRY